ncbi:hypothetical protein RIF29_19304 [Crotalaria pallida]|uniref:Uncharacterized protein n=1 Tax=Crotalaria pallida TaxID=3830 RepID=A0AAN9EZA3_CROPI
MWPWATMEPLCWCTDFMWHWVTMGPPYWCIWGLFANVLVSCGIGPLWGLCQYGGVSLAVISTIELLFCSCSPLLTRVQLFLIFSL